MNTTRTDYGPLEYVPPDKCESKQPAPRNSLCHPDHECDLLFAHDGRHQCSCGLRWNWRQFERDDVKEEQAR